MGHLLSELIPSPVRPSLGFRRMRRFDDVPAQATPPRPTTRNGCTSAPRFGAVSTVETPKMGTVYSTCQPVPSKRCRDVHAIDTSTPGRPGAWATSVGSYYTTVKDGTHSVVRVMALGEDPEKV